MAQCLPSNPTVWPSLRKNKHLSISSSKQMKQAYSREKFSSNLNPSLWKIKSISMLLLCSLQDMLLIQKVGKVLVLISRIFMPGNNLFLEDLSLTTVPKLCHLSQFYVKDTSSHHKSLPWLRPPQKSDKNKAKKSCSSNPKMVWLNLSAKCKSSSSASPKSPTKTEPTPKHLP